MAYGLDAGEEVLVEVPANLMRGFEASGGLLTVTSKRLIFEAHSINMNRQPAEIPLVGIAGLEKGSSLMSLVNNRLRVFTNSGMAYDFVVQRRNEVVDLVERLLIQVESGSTPEREQRVVPMSIASELGKLNDLYQQGALTEQEFADAKAQLLGK